MRRLRDNPKDFFEYLGEGSSPFERWLARAAGVAGAVFVMLGALAPPQPDLTWIVVIYYISFVVFLGGFLYVGIKSVGRGLGKTTFFSSLAIVLKRVWLYLFLPCIILTIIAIMVAWLIEGEMPLGN